MPSKCGLSFFKAKHLDEVQVRIRTANHLARGNVSVRAWGEHQDAVRSVVLNRYIDGAIPGNHCGRLRIAFSARGFVAELSPHLP